MANMLPFVGLEEGEFAGFEHPDASFIMCPNEFLDFLLPNASRGCVRLVGYVLYQTYRWVDDSGQPNNQQIEIPLSDLIKKAGISRGAAKASLDEAIEGKYLKLVRAGAAKSKGNSGTRTVVALNWSSKPTVAKTLEEFDGFYQGRGNFTTVPHSYFEHLLRSEKLAVLRFVGFVFRNTVGYQTQFGRRKVVPLSYEFVQKYAGISSSDTLAQTIRHSLQSNYVERVEQGVFGPGTQQSSASVFAPKFAASKTIGSKNEVVNDAIAETQSVQKPKRGQFRKRIEKSPENESVHQFKNRSVLNNQEEKTQQTNEVDEKIQILINAGFERRSATTLAKQAGREVIERQIQWMKHRKYKSYLGFLRKAITENFDEPDVLIDRRKRRERHVKQNQEAAVRTNAQSEAAAKLKAYKHDLSRRWSALNIEQREQIKSAALKRCTPSIRSYLQKRSIEGPPALEFANEFALQSNLPTTLEYESRVLKCSSTTDSSP